MDAKRFKEPAFAVSAAALALIVASWVFPSERPCRNAEELTQALAEANSRLATIESQLSKTATGDSKPAVSSAADAVSSAADEEEQFRDALRLAEERLASGQVQQAYDLVLVASRLRPSSPELFDLLIKFIEKCRDAEDEDTRMLADDLVGRGESLIHFQRPDDVPAARARFMAVSQALAPQKQQEERSPFAQVLEYVEIAENAVLAAHVRTRAADQARSMLAEVLLAAAIQSDGEHFPLGESDAIGKRIDAAEHACIGELFRDVKTSAEHWLGDSKKLLHETKSVNADGTPAVVGRLSASIVGGSDLLHELTPYAKSGVADASDALKHVEKQITALHRAKLWLYNQQVLRLIRDVESRKDLSLDEKIGYLAEVDEEMLSPYILRRHNELWEKLFEKLPDEDKKAAAVRLSILHVKE